MIQTSKIAFIGGGNMTRAIVGGLIAEMSEATRPAVVIAEPDSAKADALAADFGVQVTADNHQAVDGAGIVVMAVKPQVMQTVAQELASSITAEQLLVSIAAGIPGAVFSSWFAGHEQWVRAMPNTPALVNSGATGLFAPDCVSSEQRNDVESLLRSVGLAQWFADEGMLDAVTAVSGSGPAYVFYLMEAMMAEARALGLNDADARVFTLETVYGAAKLALSAADDPATLRARVSSPGGTTEQAIATLDQRGVSDAVRAAMQAAFKRSQELAEQAGQNKT